MNHDLLHNDMTLLDRTPLGLLNNIGLIKLFGKDDNYINDEIEIRGFHYTEKVEPSKTNSKIRICLGHIFYENSFDLVHNLTDKDCNELGYNYYILGHDHTVYEDKVKPNYTLYRIGSISRGTANENQMIRDTIHFLELDTETEIFNKVPIPCLPAKEIFKESVFLRKEENKIDTEKVLDNLVFTSNDNIYDVLDRSEQTKEIKDIVETYLQAAGIYRNL